MKQGDAEGLSPLIVALDTPDLDEARRTASRLVGLVDVVKVGLELFSSAGPEAVTRLREDGFEVFLDLKLCDIPNTVMKACRSLVELDPLLITLHATGGQEMMRAAFLAVRERVNGSGSNDTGSLDRLAFESREPGGTERGRPAGSRIRLRAGRPLLIGVTILTSIDLLALDRTGVKGPVEEQVLRLAELAHDSGMDGLVTSPLETLAVRRMVGPGMLLITPGIRPEGASRDDQMRVATPGRAFEDGTDFIVVGRPVTEAEEPGAAAKAILEEAGLRDD